MDGHCLTNEQILAFSTALFQAERSQATVEKYLRSVRAFSLFLDGQPVTKDTVMAWKKRLQREENYSPSTINASLAALNYLFNFLSKEAAAALAELAMADKDAIVSDKIFKGLADGRVSKQLKEICLLDQTYVKAEDGKQTVAKYLESVNKALTIAKVVRFEVGEGMEKKNEDFAAEVAAQMKG